MEQWLSRAANSQYNPLLPLAKSKHDFRIEDVPDLREIIKGKNALQNVQKISPQLLYRALQQKGPEDSLDVLALLSTEQFRHIVDYDVWNKGELVPARVFYWLELYGRISPEALISRFQSLDEEYQIASLCRFIRVYSHEEYEKMDEAAQDRLFRFPQDALFYSILGGDENIERGIQTLVDACMGTHMQYIMSLLAHSAYAPPQEVEHLLKQFRSARLEEEGFVPYEESLELFFPLDPEVVAGKWQDTAVSRAELSHLQEDKYFLQTVVEALPAGESADRIKQGLLYLVNALSQAADVDCNDKKSMNALFEHVYGLVNLGLEYLSQKNLEKALRILQEEYPKRLFQLALGLISPSCKLLCSTLDNIDSKGKMQFTKWYAQRKQMTIADNLDTHYLNFLGFTRTELCKGVLNRLPMLLQKAKNLSDKSEDALYFVFAPLSTLQDLNLFRTSVSALCQAIKFMQGSSSLQRLPSLDSYFSTLFIRSVLYAELTFEPLSLLELEKFSKLAESEVQKGQEFFHAWLENRCDEELTNSGREMFLSEMDDLLAELILKNRNFPQNLLNIVVSTKRLGDGEIIMTIENKEFIDASESGQLAHILNIKYGVHRGERAFTIKAEQDLEQVRVKVVLQNKEQTYYYPIDGRINYRKQEITSREAVLLLLDYIDVYFDEFFKEDEEVYLTIDYKEFLFEGIQLELRGQILNLQLERRADEMLEREQKI